MEQTKEELLNKISDLRFDLAMEADYTIACLLERELEKSLKELEKYERC